MTERSQAFLDAILALAKRPATADSDVRSQFPRVDAYTRAENLAFVEGALYANDWLMDCWRSLEGHEPKSAFTEETQIMFVYLINTIGEQARLEADHRYPPFDKPTARDIKLGKFIPVQQ